MVSVPTFAFPTQELLQEELRRIDAEKGGDFSNTPPSNSQRASGSEDTAVISCGVNWGDNFDNLMQVLELRKQESRVDGGDCAARFGDFVLAVGPAGFSAGGYVAYQLAGSGVRLGVASTRSPYGETPNVYINMGSAVLMYNDGIEPVWWHVQEVIKAMGGELLWHKVSRVDVCVDLWDVEVRDLHEDYRQGCVTRAKYKVTYEWTSSRLTTFPPGLQGLQLFPRNATPPRPRRPGPPRLSDLGPLVSRQRDHTATTINIQPPGQPDPNDHKSQIRRQGITEQPADLRRQRLNQIGKRYNFHELHC